jgi:pimeloyl-ACP methyl ester carboxylesterase
MALIAPEAAMHVNRCKKYGVSLGCIRSRCSSRSKSAFGWSAFMTLPWASAASRRAWSILAFAAILALLSSCGGKQGPPRAQVRPAAASDGTVLDVRTIGKGEPILLLTGFAMTSEMWDREFVMELAASRRVVLLDNVGMGPSAPGAGVAVSIRRMADDAVAALDALEIEKCDVLGWSMGAMIAQEVALARPDKVRSLVLMSSAAEAASLMPGLEKINSMDGASIRGAMFQPDWLKDHPEALSRVAARPRPPDLAIIQAQRAAILTWEGTIGRLETLRHPVLILAGEDDWLCPPEASRAIHALLSIRPGNPSVLVEFGMGSHWMMHQYPITLARMVNGYLSGQRHEGR